MGRFVEALQARGIRNDTLIVFTSDNGPETLDRYRGAERSYGRPDPLRGMKLHTHDAGFRVAGIVNWPGRIPSAQVVSTPVSSLDLLPTFCEVASAEVSEHLVLDGTSILPLLDNEQLVRPKPLVWCYFNALNEARVAMRHGRWKVLAQLNGGNLPKMQNITNTTAQSVLEAQLTDFEIYDIEEDVRESNNLVNSQDEAIGDLQSLLISSYRELVGNSHVWTVKNQD